MPHGGAALLAGPAFLLLLLAVFACVLLVGAWSRGLDRLWALGARARAVCARGRALSMLWGVSAGTLILAVSVLLFQIRPLALLGVLLLLAGAVVLSLGLAVTAFTVGDALTPAGKGGGGPADPLRVGLVTLLLASCLPFVGWLLCLLLIACGTGAVLEALLGRE